METQQKPKTGLALLLLALLIGGVSLGAKVAYDQWVKPTMAQFTPQIEEAKRRLEQGKAMYEDYQKLKESGVIEDIQELHEDVEKLQNP